MEGVVLVVVVLILLWLALAALSQTSPALKLGEAPEPSRLGEVPERSRSAMLIAQILPHVFEHRAALRIKRLQLVKVDAYGNELTDAWFKEMVYFTNTVVQPRVGHLHKQDDQPLHILTTAIIEEVLRNPEEENAFLAASVGVAGRNLAPAQTPLTFEAQCAEAARLCGWNARTTKVSGDQGVDVIAELNGLRVVFQCKLQATPVGNAAVQQIVAGKHFEQAQFAAVVSNSGYTPAARQLAVATKVELLHPSEIGDYLSRIASVQPT